MPHDVVFPEGAAVVGQVTPDMEYISGQERARGKQPKQKVDDQTGLPQWKVTVSDPSADKDRDKSVTILDKVQPVPPPAAIPGFDFRSVVFDGLTAEPRVSGQGEFKYLAWTLRATGMREPASSTPPKSSGGKSTTSGQGASEQKAA
ncbi:hypothetical protein [Tamaricihabitans halophyticus]|nr:hypothetical protein [Tamaricihabitans halophyticus]